MGEEVQHIISYDSNGIPLEGSKNYNLNLPPNIPVREFWSLIVYDCQTRLIIQNGQPWPSVHSKSRRLVVNENGSVDVWFGPEAPAGKVNNWILTIPGRGWSMILHLYDPLEAWFNRTWRPGEIEEMQMTMANEAKNSEGPVCACGRGDLYMESLKLKENDTKDVSGSDTANQFKDNNSSVDTPDKEDQKA